MIARARRAPYRLAWLVIALTIALTLTGCKADWADIFGSGSDNADSGDATPPVADTTVAGLDIAPADGGFGDTASLLRSDLQDRADRVLRYSFTVDARSDSSDSSTSRRARSFLFADANRMVPIIQADARAALDLPAHMLVYEDADGDVGVAYDDPDYLRARYNVAAANGALTALADDLRTLAQDAAGAGVSIRGSVSGIGRAQGIVGRTSDDDFQTTLDRLRDAVDARDDVRVADEVDFRQLANDTGQSLGANTLVVLRVADTEAPLVRARRTSAIDLPQKMLVAQVNGQVIVYYNDPDYIAARHGIDGQRDVRDTIGQALAELAASAAGGSSGLQ